MNTNHTLNNKYIKTYHNIENVYYYDFNIKHNNDIIDIFGSNNDKQIGRCIHNKMYGFVLKKL